MTNFLIITLRHKYLPLQVTYADMAVYVLMECLVTQAPNILGTFPWISKLMEGVEKLEAIRAWIQSRPETEH